jgi:hypothetical protein
VNGDIVSGLLDDMEEYYGAFDHYPLYLLGWSLRNGGPMTDRMAELAQQAYIEFTSRHPTKVVWVPWPLPLEQARNLDPGTPLDFDLDPDSPIDEPLQVIVPADYAVKA